MPLVYNPASKSYEVWEQPMSGSVSYINPTQPATVVNPQSLQPVTYDKTNIPIEVTPQLEAANAPVVGYVSGEKGQEKSYALKTPLSQEQFNMQFPQPSETVQQAPVVNPLTGKVDLNPFTNEPLPKQNQVVSLPDALSAAAQASKETFSTGMNLPTVGELKYGDTTNQVVINPKVSDYVETHPESNLLAATRWLSTPVAAASAFSIGVGSAIRYTTGNLGAGEKFGIEATRDVWTSYVKSLEQEREENTYLFYGKGLLETSIIAAPFIAPEISSFAGSISSRLPFSLTTQVPSGIISAAPTLLKLGLGGGVVGLGYETQIKPNIEAAQRGEPLAGVQIGLGIGEIAFGGLTLLSGGLDVGKKIVETKQYLQLGQKAELISNVNYEDVGLRGTVDIGKGYETNMKTFLMERPEIYKAGKEYFSAFPERTTAAFVQTDTKVLPISDVLSRGTGKGLIQIGTSTITPFEYAPTLFEQGNVFFETTPNVPDVYRISDMSFYGKSIGKNPEFAEQIVAGWGKIEGVSDWLKNEEFQFASGGISKDVIKPFDTTTMGIAGQLGATKDTEGIIDVSMQKGLFRSEAAYGPETSTFKLPSGKVVEAFGGKTYFTYETSIIGRVPAISTGTQTVFGGYKESESGGLILKRATSSLNLGSLQSEAAKTVLDVSTAKSVESIISPPEFKLGTIIDTGTKASSFSGLVSLSVLNKPKVEKITKTDIVSLGGLKTSQKTERITKEVSILKTPEKTEYSTSIFTPVTERLSQSTIQKTSTILDLGTLTKVTSEKATTVPIALAPIPSPKTYKPTTEPITRINLPPTVPFQIDFGGGAVPRLSKIFTGISRSYKYTPSLVGMYRGERISRTPRGTLTGLEIRPVVGPKPKKRSALDVVRGLPSVTKLKLGKQRATKLKIKL